MWIPSSSGCSVSELLSILQGFVTPQVSDGFLRLWAKELLDALLIFGFFWLLAELTGKLLNKWGIRLTTITRSELDDRLLGRVIPCINRLLVMLGLYLAIRSLPLNEKLLTVVTGVLFISLVVIIFNLVYQVINELIRWYLASRKDGSDVDFSRHMQPMAEKIVMLFLSGAALIVVLKHFNYDIFSLVTALGIGSLAIGMAAKDTLAHMISGFTLMLDRPFQIGDRIRLTNGQTGDVLDIGLRSTRIKALDGPVLIIPNSDLCNSTLVNLVRPEPFMQGRVSVGVGYGSDVSHVKELMLSLAINNTEVLSEPAPVVFFTAFGEFALNMQLLFWVKDPTRIGAVTDQLNCSILSCFRDNGVEIPFPVRTVRVEQDPTLLPCRIGEP